MEYLPCTGNLVVYVQQQFTYILYYTTETFPFSTNKEKAVDNHGIKTKT